MRLAVVLAVAFPLAAADLATKEMWQTPWWAWHTRSSWWLLLCVVLFAATLASTMLPSRLIPPAAGLLAAGVLGNGLSAVWNGLRVPNPIVVQGDQAVVAFNLADVWTITGILALTVALAFLVLRHRALLPPPRRLLTADTWRRLR